MARRPEPRPKREAPPPTELLSLNVVTRFGDTWRTLAGHSLVWSFVLLEIPRQVFERETTQLSAIHERIAELTRFYPGDIASIDFEREKLDPSRRLCCEFTDHDDQEFGVMPAGIVEAAIVKSVDKQFARVTFRLDHMRELAIRTDVEARPGRPKLPTFLVNAPRSVEDARQTAASLVRAAIVLVDF